MKQSRLVSLGEAVANVVVGYGGEAIAVVPLKPGTYLLRAEDSGGLAGPEVRVSTKGAQVLAFSPLGFLQADPGFVGTKSGLAVSGTNLMLATASRIGGRKGDRRRFRAGRGWCGASDRPCRNGRSQS